MTVILFKILMVLLVFFLFLNISLAYLEAKNENTYMQHMIINAAIADYQMKMIDEFFDSKEIGLSDHPIFEVTFDDVEPYEKTMYRIFDWGYTRLLPKDKFEIIKPFIK